MIWNIYCLIVKGSTEPLDGVVFQHNIMKCQCFSVSKHSNWFGKYVELHDYSDETTPWIFRYWTICNKMLIARRLLNDFISSDKHGKDEGEGGFACFLSLVHWQTRGMDSHCVLSRKEISVKNDYRYSLWLIHQTVTICRLKEGNKWQINDK